MFYEEIYNWQPNKFDIEGVDYYLNELQSHFGVSKVELGNFPKSWISIHKLDDRYVAYNPLNGIDMRFILTDGSINTSQMESDADLISEIVSHSSTTLILKLNTIPQKRKSQIEFL